MALFLGEDDFVHMLFLFVLVVCFKFSFVFFYAGTLEPSNSFVVD